MAKDLKQDIIKIEEQLRQLNKSLLKTSINFLKTGENAKKFGSSLSKNVKATRKLKVELTDLRKKQKEVKDDGPSFIRNQRLISNSFATLRSRILLASFALNTARQIVNGLIGVFSEYDSAVRRLTTAFARTGYIANITTSEITNYASELQKATGISDTLIVNSAGLLATFTNVRDEAFIRGTEAIVQMTDAMYYGAVTQENLRTTTIQMGKALNDPIKGMTALRRVGVTFTETQKLQIHNFIRMGDLASAQKVILDELNDEFGDTANIDSYSKSIGKMMSAFGDLQKQIGAFLAPKMKEIVDGLTRLFEAVDLADIKVGVLATSVGLLAGAFMVLMTPVNIGVMGVIGLSTAIGLLATSIFAVTTDTNQWEISVDKTTKALEKQFELIKGGSIQDYEKQLENVKKAMTDTAVRMDKSIFPVFLTDEQLKEMESQLIAFLNFKTKEKDALMAVATANKLDADILKIGNEERLKSIGLINKETAEKIKSKRGQIKRTPAEEYRIEKEAIIELTKVAIKRDTTLAKMRENDEKGFQIAKNQIIEKLKLKREELEMDKALQVQEEFRAKRNQEFINVGFQLATSTSSTLFQMSKDRLNAEQEIINKRYNDERDLILNSVKSEKVKAAQLDALNKQKEASDKNLHNKTIGLQIGQAITQGIIGMLGVVVNTAVANSKLSSQLGVAAPPAIAANTAMGVAQGALIAAQTGLQVAQLGAQRKQYGADQIVTSPTLFMAGEGAMAERVTVTPTNSNAGTSNQININFTGNILSKDFIEDEAIPMIRDALRRGDSL
tara:strand:- start:1223 stop:3586 length:2364 start_codon:yes stop_codon:yes gene_type:complete